MSRNGWSLNHDVTHCADWKHDCPRSCDLYKLSWDLLTRFDLVCVPISYAHFKGTDICKLKKKGVEGV